MADNEKLLKEIRSRFEYCVDSWANIRREAQKDMLFVSGDPWDAKEREARRKANRPCLSLDELGQYINQRINDVRQNKRAIKVSPGDGGGDESTAELHADIIRTIEYKSNAQAAYTTAFENALQRSYGFFRIGKRYISPASFDQELFIDRIPNPDTVYIDPDCKQADGSDMEYAFVIEEFQREDFTKRWPKAQVQDFPSEFMTAYPYWVKERTIQVAEYWRIEKKVTELLLVSMNGQPAPKGLYADEVKEIGGVIEGETLTIPGGPPLQIVKRRKTERKTVVPYLTNGVEILEVNEWEGKYVPVVPVYGKEIYVDRGAGSERILMSLIRLARDPQMLFCYYKTAEAELVGMTPKTPYIGYEGQFEGREEEWGNANRVPYAYLQVKPVLDATGQSVLPLPQRQVYEPPIQAMEMGAESARRSIQNSMGMYNASVGRQDSQIKSGIAIKALDLQSDQGNFHFIDNYDRALEHAGRILDDMIPFIYDAPRNVSIRKPDDQVKAIPINQPYKDPKTGETKENRVGGEHSVTISTGPSYESQREEASTFADTIAGNPQIFALIGDLVVKMKNLGPLGDEMAKRLTPPQFAEDKGQGNAAALQQKLQQADQMIQMMTEQMNKLTEELKSDQAKAQADMQIAAQKLQAEIQIAQQKLQAEMQMAQVKAQADSQATMQKGQADAEVATQKAEMDTRKMSAELILKREIAAAELESEERIAEKKLQFEMAKAQMEIASQERIEAARIESAGRIAEENRKVVAAQAKSKPQANAQRGS